ALLFTSVVLLLLSLLVLGMVWVASAIVGNDAASRQSLYDLWEYYLPYLYSCISLFGVLLLLLCTPFGLSIMFTVTGKLLVKPRLLEDLDEQLSCTRFEEAAVTGSLSSVVEQWVGNGVGAFTSHPELRHRASPWQRNLGYPLAMLGLLALTVSGPGLPGDCCWTMPRCHGDASLGQVSFSIFGSFGAALQVVLIFYLMVSSVVGFYSSPLFTRLLPERQDTPLTKIIGNCVSLLVLSSALPVFSRTLGEHPKGIRVMPEWGCPQDWGALTPLCPTPVQGSPALTSWVILDASTGWETSTSSSSTTWALRGSPRCAW
uniref:Uncharacterized protein n=1 Tax=Malurus cyaneus samueli TaxID=2593467 RepID=A0A8C5X7N1_9PASS